ncbi:NnrS family protein [Achromobacter aegrifaciens]|uniref:NnrS protein n=2 Tax=Achromobacter aegrifaciens TaxID=1287736 RepID=A0AAD2J0B8_ACHAE|nr:NnrS family protein [Achromobacter aegrifaciens]MDQ1760111.1 NnrS family protein [Achromobacter aegrifaciens]CUJ19947.1 NnrS protein [Achromobacter aegrifaciens]
MSTLLSIEEPAAAPPRPRPQWRAFTEMGFRPLYLAGCFWALASVLLWVHAPARLTGVLNGMFWHAHEMLWGFVATIAVGFLLTAGANWTGKNPLHGTPLAILCAVWIVARAGYLVPGRPAFVVAAAADLLFFLWAAGALGRAVAVTRNQRNYGIPFLLLGLAATNALYLWASVQGDYFALMRYFNAGLLCMAVLTLLIARRVIPFFAKRAVAGLDIPPHTRSGHWQLGTGIVAIACLLAGQPQAAALALAATGLIALAQWISWKPWAVRKVPLLWILYAGYCGLGIGLLAGAAQLAGYVLRPAWPAHVIGVAGFSVLILGMVTRTALGHLGRPLQTDRSMVLSYALMILAALLRLAALLPTAATIGFLHASATAWALAFALYLWRFFPMMIRPRADAGKTAAPVMKVVPVARRPAA